MCLFLGRQIYVRPPAVFLSYKNNLLSHNSVSGACQSEYKIPKQACCFPYHFAVVYDMEGQDFVFLIKPYSLFFFIHILKFLFVFCNLSFVSHKP